MRVSREKSSFTAFHLCRRTGRTSVLPVRRHFAASCNVFFKLRAEQNLFGLCRGKEKVRDSELMPFDEKFFREIAASATSACRSAIGSTPSTFHRLARSQSCICRNLTKKQFGIFAYFPLKVIINIRPLSLGNRPVFYRFLPL